jgi:phosphatidylglycerol:prolipoprotein diacylglycerol transferase
MWGLFGGILGARLVYVLLEMSEFRGNPAAAFHIWEGGMSFHGGLLGGIAAGVLVCRARGIVVGDMADLAAVSFPIGYALGRVGCFLNGCCYGNACDLPWAVRFHTQGGGLTEPSHPAQLYSALISVVIYLILARLEPLRRFRGQLMLAYIFLYSAYRFFIEQVREGATARPVLAGLTHGQVASLLLAALAVALYVALARRASRHAAPNASAFPAT